MNLAKQQSGYILLVVMMLLGILAIAGLSTTESNIVEQRMTINAEEKEVSFNCAEILRASLAQNFEQFMDTRDWPISMGGSRPNEEFSGLVTGSLEMKAVLNKDGEAETGHGMPGNAVEYKDADGNAIEESNHWPVNFKTDIEFVEKESGKNHASLSIYSQTPVQLPGNAVGANMGYKTKGHGQTSAVASPFQFRSSSTQDCTNFARTIVENDYIYIPKD